MYFFEIENRVLIDKTFVYIYYASAHQPWAGASGPQRINRRLGPYDPNEFSDLSSDLIEKPQQYIVIVFFHN